MVPFARACFKITSTFIIGFYHENLSQVLSLYIYLKEAEEEIPYNWKVSTVDSRRPGATMWRLRSTLQDSNLQWTGLYIYTNFFLARLRILSLMQIPANSIRVQCTAVNIITYWKVKLSNSLTPFIHSFTSFIVLKSYG